jgi:hypothetical protein
MKELVYPFYQKTIPIFIILGLLVYYWNRKNKS